MASHQNVPPALYQTVQGPAPKPAPWSGAYCEAREESRFAVPPESSQAERSK